MFDTCSTQLESRHIFYRKS